VRFSTGFPQVLHSHDARARAAREVKATTLFPIGTLTTSLSVRPAALRALAPASPRTDKRKRPHAVRDARQWLLIKDGGRDRE
jgi:hypothetical protein